MTQDTFSRRRMLSAAALGAPALALSGQPAEGYQGNMERALSALGAAMQSLQAATPNKGDHRERATRLIEHAMGEVQQESILPTSTEAAATEAERGLETAPPRRV